MSPLLLGAALAGCDPLLLSVSIEALDTAEDARVAPWMAGDLAEACAFEPPLQGALERASRESRDLDVLSEPWLTWIAERCPHPAPTAWEACELARAGITTRSGWEAARGYPFLALRVHGALLATGTDADTAQIVFRRLAGIHRAPPDGVIREFAPLFP